jgi:hypothetical protein
LHTLLLVLLALDALQLLVAAAALVRGRRSLRAGAPSHARYSFLHAALLAAGSLVLAVPLLLGLGDVLSDDVAVYLALALELAAFPLARAVLGRLEAAHFERRPA